jgi:hypothetical protein
VATLAFIVSAAEAARRRATRICIDCTWVLSKCI